MESFTIRSLKDRDLILKQQVSYTAQYNSFQGSTSLEKVKVGSLGVFEQGHVDLKGV